MKNIADHNWFLPSMQIVKCFVHYVSAKSHNTTHEYDTESHGVDLWSHMGALQT
jgi:hypothetical protein